MFKNIKVHILSLLILFFILISSSIINEVIVSNFQFFPSGFFTQFSFILFSLVLIRFYNFEIKYFLSIPQFFKILPFIFILIFGILFILDVIIPNSDSGSILNIPVKELVTILLINCFGEEFLFRGFLQNYYSDFKKYQFDLFKIKISYPVFISGLLFGLMHFAIMSTGVDFISALKIVISATCVGLFSGYYYEKYNALFAPIIIHFTCNLSSMFYSLAMS
tara:strand:- start:25 stop:687 length:663 start_codon:yes stop_codon:yes gene_type:complete